MHWAWDGGKPQENNVNQHLTTSVELSSPKQESGGVTEAGERQPKRKDTD